MKLKAGSIRNLASYKREITCSLCRDLGGFEEVGTLYGKIVWRDFCTCEEGQRQKTEHEKGQAEWERAQQEQRIARIFSWADEPERFRGWTLKTYPADGDKEALAACLRYLKNPNDDKNGLFLTGFVGRGKTGLAVGIIRTLTAQGESCLFIQTGVYLDKLREAFDRKNNLERREENYPSAEQLREVARTVPVLALDELGDPDRRTPPSDWVREEVFNLINYRYAHSLRTIITTNLKDRQLLDHFGERTAQRIKHMCETVLMQGRNLREKRS